MAANPFRDGDVVDLTPVGSVSGIETPLSIASFPADYVSQGEEDGGTEMKSADFFPGASRAGFGRSVACTWRI